MRYLYLVDIAVDSSSFHRCHFYFSYSIFIKLISEVIHKFTSIKLFYFLVNNI